MQKLYLIRRGLDTFLGPMSLQELRSSYGKMAFGFQDELSGHLGPWVPLENVEIVRRNYPEVAAIVHHDISTSWGGGDQITKIMRPPRTESRSKTAKPKTSAFAFGFFLMAAAAATAAFYLARTAKLNGKSIFDDAEPINVAAANALNSGEAEFQSFMGAQLRTVVPKVLRSKTAMQNWLPYLRAYAFMETGEIDGLSANVLRGNINNSASSLPSECQLRYWQRRWASVGDSISVLVASAPPPKGHWTTFLQWDPYWLRRRKASGWIRPHNYYEACLAMANKAFFETFNGSNSQPQPPAGMEMGEWKNSIGLIEHRLLVLKTIIGAKGTEEIDALGRQMSPSGKDALSIASCADLAPTVEILNSCMLPVRESKAVWGSYFDVRYRINALRILMNDPSRFDDPRFQEVIFQGEAISQDPVTGLDYKAEWSTARYLKKYSGQWDGAPVILTTQFPEINFRDFLPPKAQ